MTVRRIPASERRARLGRRHGLASAHRHRNAAEAADLLVGLHGSDPATPFLAARARVDGFVTDHLEADLYDRGILTKHLCMRRTLFVVGTVLPVVHSACTKVIAATEWKRFVKMVEDGGVTSDGARWLRRAEKSVLAALGELGPSTGASLARAVPEIQAKLTYGEGKSWGGQIGVSTRVFSQLAMEGRIRRGRATSWTSSQHRWELVERPPADLDRAVATTALVRRWLGAFGPATMTDLTWWTGLGVTRIRPALAGLEVAEMDLDGEVGLVLPDDLEPVAQPEPWVALLPSLDPTAMGWKQRHWYLGEHEAPLFDRNGNIGPTIWSDGRIVGGWSQSGTGEVRFRLLEDLGREVVDMVEAEVAALQEWLGDVVLKPRFPTPLDRELRASS